jgi:hypothetical protein
LANTLGLVKQHLRIKRFYGTSENAVKSQIWIAVSVYLLVAIVKKRLNLDASLYTLLQILSVTLFEKMLLCQAVNRADRGDSGKTGLYGFAGGRATRTATPTGAIACARACSTISV